MKNFTYYQPKTVQQAVGLLDAAWGKAELLAGGTDLLDRQKEYIDQPEKVISLGGLNGAFRKISEINPPGAFPPSVTIGAGVTLAEIASNETIKRVYPALAQAAGVIAGPQIRNMGTLGGSLCQRNRCWYFRDEHVKCLLKGGDKCYALPADAENRYHAIFTQGLKCVIVHPSTIAPVLTALGGSAKVVGPNGERDVPFQKLFQAPSSADQREHTLAANEVLVSVTCGGAPEQFLTLRNAHYEVRQKDSSDWPIVQAVAALWMKDKAVRLAQVVLGHVAPTPVLSADASAALMGKEVTEELAAEAAKAAVKGAKPLGQNGYKVRLAEVAVKRAILAAVGKKYWEG
jgi:xanthine dehydrogenase YagS FAD-binding subunit